MAEMRPIRKGERVVIQADMFDKLRHRQDLSRLIGEFATVERAIYNWDGNIVEEYIIHTDPDPHGMFQRFVLPAHNIHPLKTQMCPRCEQPQTPQEMVDYICQTCRFG